VLITMLGPISGAHMNPAVSLPHRRVSPTPRSPLRGASRTPSPALRLMTCRYSSLHSSLRQALPRCWRGGSSISPNGSNGSGAVAAETSHLGNWRPDAPSL
jgi:hypothetical protein